MSYQDPEIIKILDDEREVFDNVPFKLPEPEPPIILTASDGSTVISADQNAPISFEPNGLVINSTGHIRSGQTAFNTGTGFFLGNVAGTPKFSIGNPAANYISWDGTTLTVIGNQVVVTDFTANGTWTKPTGAKLVVVQVWGGGGSGGSGNGVGGGGAGGGGGAYLTGDFPAASLTATVAVTVGALQSTVGSTGNDSSFGAYVVSYAGGGGGSGATSCGGGGGGGVLGDGANGTAGGAATGGAGGGPAGSAASTSNDGFAGAGGGTASVAGGSAVYGGSGGGATNANGGSTVYGGAGGGGGNTSVSAGTGGTSLFGGAGGAGGFAAGNGTDGTAPGGGGGGGGKNGLGGAGARGLVRVTTYL